MCGLVGIFGNVNTVKKEDFFEDLLQVDVVRGMDATGVAIVNSGKGKPKIFKGAVLPPVIIKNTKYTQAKSGTHILMMGHNRAATIGEVINQNAHPFNIGDITLAHNGTIFNFKHTLGDGQEFQTDSETLTYSISKIGIAETWKKIDGAATLTYWDSRHKTFNMISNGKRPIHFTYTDDKGCLLYASERWMLEAIAERHNIDLVSPTKDGEANIWYPKDHMLFTFKLVDNEVKETVIELQPKPPFVPYNCGYGADLDGYGGGLGWEEDLRLARNQQNTPINQEKDKRIIFPFKGKTTFHEPKKEFMKRYEDILAPTLLSIVQFQDRYKTCYSCEGPLKDEYDTTIILDTEIAMCKDCVLTCEYNGVPITKASIKC